MSLFDHFKPWKLVAEMEVHTTWTGGLFFPDRTWKEKYTVAFYEKTPRLRKIKFVGEKDSRVKEMIEPRIYRWRDHKGELPYGAIEVKDED